MNSEKTSGEKGSIPFFDATASEYDRLYEEISPGGYAFRIRKKRLLDMLDECEGRLLDVGCGPGILAEDFIGKGYKYWGIDASESMIMECYLNSKVTDEAHFSVGNAQYIPFPDESFDVVICMGVIDRIKEYKDAIKEMTRVLKSGGTIMIAFPNFCSPWASWRNFIFYPLLAILRPVYYCLRGKSCPPALSSVAKMHTRRGASKLLQHFYVEVTGIVYYNFNILLSPLDEWFPGITMRITERVERLHAGTLRWLGSGFILKGEKRRS